MAQKGQVTIKKRKQIRAARRVREKEAATQTTAGKSSKTGTETVLWNSKFRSQQRSFSEAEY